MKMDWDGIGESEVQGDAIVNVDWDGVNAAAYEALKNCLALEDRAFCKGGEDMRAIAVRMVEFWRAQIEGKTLTGNILDTAIHRARLLCETYGVNGHGRAKKIEVTIKTFAFIGAELLTVAMALPREGGQEP